MLNPSPASVRVRAGQEGLFKAGDVGPLWRVVEGTARLDRETGSSRLPVQLALPSSNCVATTWRPCAPAVCCPAWRVCCA